MIRKVKRFISNCTEFKPLYRMMSAWTIISIVALIILPIIESRIAIDLLDLHVLDSTSVQTVMCSVTTAVALLNYTNLTVMLNSASNKSFGIPLKDLLNKCKWRLRPFFILFMSMFAIMASVICMMWEKGKGLLVVLVWLIVYTMLYCLIMWKLIINSKFVSDFLVFQLEKGELKGLDERKRILGLIMEQIDQVEEDERIYAIEIIKNILNTDNQTIVDHYVTAMVRSLSYHLRDDKIDIDRENFFRVLCREIIVKTKAPKGNAVFDYELLLSRVYRYIQREGEESLNKYLQLKKLENVIHNEPGYDEKNKIGSVGNITDGDLKDNNIENAKQILRKEFTKDLDEKGVNVAYKTLMKKAKRLEFKDEEIADLYVDMYEKLYYASPEELGKYEMGRHFPDFVNLFINEKENNIYSEKVALRIMSVYLEVIMQNPALASEKRGNSLKLVISVGLEEYEKGNYQGKSKERYEEFLRFIALYSVTLIVQYGKNKGDRERWIRTFLNPLFRREYKMPELHKKILVDFYLLLGYAKMTGIIDEEEFNEVMKFKAGVQDKDLKKICKDNYYKIQDYIDIRVLNKLTEFMGKEPVTERGMKEIKNTYEVIAGRKMRWRKRRMRL